MMLRRYVVSNSILRDEETFTSWLDSHNFSRFWHKVKESDDGWTLVEVEVLL